MDADAKRQGVDSMRTPEDNVGGRSKIGNCGRLLWMAPNVYRYNVTGVAVAT